MSLSTSSFRRYVAISVVGGGVLLASFLAILEVFLLEQAAKNEEGLSYRDRFLTADAPWAAFGDSHVEGSLLSDDYLDNLGQASDNLDTVIGKVELRLQKGGLNGVILPADPQLFSFYRISAEQGDRLDVLGREYSEDLKILDPEFRPYLGKTFWVIAKNPSVLIPMSEGTSTNVIVSEQNLGEPKRPSDWMKTVAIRVQLHTPVSNFAKTKNAESYKKLVRELRDSDVAVCLVRYPVSSDYLTISGSIPAFAEQEKFFLQVSREFGVPYVDISSALPGEVFVDPDHIPDDQMESVTQLVKDRCFVGKYPS